MTSSRQTLTLLKRAFPHGPASLHQNAPPPPAPATPPPPEPQPDPMVDQMQHQLEQSGQELQKLQQQSQQQQAELEHQKLQAEAAKAEAGLSKREAQLTKQEAELQKQMLEQQQQALDLKSEAQPHFSAAAQEQLKSVHKRLQSLLSKSANTYEPPVYQGNKKLDQGIIQAGETYDKWLTDGYDFKTEARDWKNWTKPFYQTPAFKGVGSMLSRPAVRRYQAAADVVEDKGVLPALQSGDWWKNMALGSAHTTGTVAMGGVGLPGRLAALGTGAGAGKGAVWGGKLLRGGARTIPEAGSMFIPEEGELLHAEERQHQQAEREMQQRDQLARQHAIAQDHKIEQEMLGDGPSLQARNYWGAYAGAPYGRPTHMRGTLDAYRSQRLADPNTWGGQLINIGMPFLSQWLTGGFQPTYGRG